MTRHLMGSAAALAAFGLFAASAARAGDRPQAAPASAAESAGAYQARVAAAAEKDPDAEGRRGHALMSQHDYAGALAAFDKAVEFDPKSPQRWVDRAHAHMALRQAAEGLDDYNHALELDPACAPALIGRGAYYVWTGDLTKAEADFAAALKAAPLDEDLQLEIAGTFASEGHYAEAIPHYDAWIAQHAKDDMLWSGLNGRCWARAMLGKDLDKALDDCNAALRKTRNSEALDSRGMVHLRLGQFQAAIEDYDAALKAAPKLAWSLYGRGLAKKRLGRTAEGEADIQAALAINPRLTKQAEKIGLVEPAPATPAPASPKPGG